MDIALTIAALVFEFFGPIVLVALAIWGIWWFVNIRKVGKSLKAAQGDEPMLRMERARLKARAISILGIPAGLAVLALAAVAGLPLEGACIGGILATGACWAWARTMKNRYARDFKDTFVVAELARVFEDLRYDPSGIFGQDVIGGLDLFTTTDRINGNDLINARYKGITFEQGDISLDEHSTVHVEDENGNSHAEDIWETRFRGRGIRFAFEKPFRGRVQVVRRDFSAARVLSDPGDWQRVETELAAFADDFAVFAPDPLDAMRVMTPQMIEGIYYLAQKLTAPLAFHFEGQAMYVFMVQSRDAFDATGKKTLLEERELLQDDINLITGFLETMYFKERTAESASGARAADAGAVVAAAGAVAGAVGVAVAAAPTVAASIGTGAGAGTIADVGADVGANVGADVGAGIPASAAAPLRRVTYAAHSTGRLLGRVARFVPFLLYALTVAFVLFQLPDEICLSFSSSGEGVTLDQPVPVLGFLLVGALFLVPTTLVAGRFLAAAVEFALGSMGSGFTFAQRVAAALGNLGRMTVALLPLLLHLLFVYVNTVFA